MRPGARRDTDDLVLGTAEREQLAGATPAGGCLWLPRQIINARLRCGRGTVTVSAPRAAWALAHPREHAHPDEDIVHTCAGVKTQGSLTALVCVDAAHLVKVPVGRPASGSGRRTR